MEGIGSRAPDTTSLLRRWQALPKCRTCYGMYNGAGSRFAVAVVKIEESSIQGCGVCKALHSILKAHTKHIQVEDLHDLWLLTAATASRVKLVRTLVCDLVLGKSTSLWRFLEPEVIGSFTIVVRG